MTEKIILESRAVLKPTPVRHHHVPRWFLKVFKRLEVYNPDWLDHWGSTTLPSGQQAFVSEPYHLSVESHIDCDRIAKEHNLDFEVHANSWHYPGWTIRLMFTRKK